MNETERGELLKEIGSLINRSIFSSLDSFNKKVEQLTDSQRNLANQVTQLSNEFKRTRETAEEAKRIALHIQNETEQTNKAIMNHIKSLEGNLKSFEVSLNDIKRETNEQTPKLNDLIVQSTDRKLQSTETQNLVKLLTGQVENLVKSESARIQKELVDDALKSKEDDRIEKFWKRLPVIIGAIIFIGGVSLWAFNALLAQSRVIQHQQNVLQTKDSK